MSEKLKKIPHWVYMVVLCVLSMGSAVFSGELMANTSFVPNQLIITIGIVAFSGVIAAFFDRLLLRVLYSTANRVYFHLMRGVPDYNLRRLPVGYNDYLRWGLVWLCVSRFVGTVLLTLCQYLLPTATYIWSFVDSLVYVACLVMAYLCINRFHVPQWQQGKCFIAFAAPVTVLVLLRLVLLGGVL